MRYLEQMQRSSIEKADKGVRLLCGVYQKLRLKAGMTFMFAAAWWGILYPELCFTQETCQVVAAAGEEAGIQTECQSDARFGMQPEKQETAKLSEGSADEKQNTEEKTVQQIDYRELMKCTGEDMIVRSRLIEWLEQYTDDFSG